jgi:flagellin
MALRINYNHSSVGALPNLARAQSAFEQVVGRLSSGLRINRAADDSAGLAVSEKLKNQVRGLNQAHRNAQDAISLLQTAEGALTETQGLLARMRELAVQSANDTLTNNDRVHIQNEVNQLVSEVDRIAKSTQYNQIALLNKNSAVTLHDAGDALQFHIGANTNLVSGAPAATSGDNAIQFNVPAGRAQDLGDVKTLKQIDASITAGNFTVNGTLIDFDPTVDTLFDVRDQINAETATTGVTAAVTNGRLTLSSLTVPTIPVADGTSNIVTRLGIPTSITQATVTGSTLVSEVSSGTGAFYFDNNLGAAETVSYTPSMTLNDLAAAMQTALRALPGESSATVTVTGGSFEIKNLVGTNIIVDPAIPAAFGLPTDGTTPLAAGAGGTTGTPMITVLATGSSNLITSGVTSLVSGTGGTVAVGSQTSANASISILDAAIDSVSSSRGVIGSLQNRLLSAMNNLGVASENTAAANSRIRDADIAQAVSEMTRVQILQEASMAVLAQANQSPMSVVQLLK